MATAAGSGAAAAAAGETGAVGLGRLMRLLRPWRRQLLIALVAAVGAAFCAVALTGTAAWLIATAAGQVPVLTLMVAIVLVRACGVGRGVLRYVERLTGHAAVLTMLVTVRRQLVGGLADRLRHGRLALTDAGALTRVNTDVDELQDAFLRGVLPYLASLVVCAAATVVSGIIYPLAGLVLLVAMLLSMIAVPLLTARATAADQRALVRARAERDTEVATLLAASDGMIIDDRWRQGVDRLSTAEQRLQGARDSENRRSALTLALAVAVTGLACVLIVGAGLGAVRSGSLSPVLLAVVVLLPLSLTDLVAAAGDCAAALGRTKAAAARVLGLLDTSAADQGSGVGGAGGRGVGGGPAGAGSAGGSGAGVGGAVVDGAGAGGSGAVVDGASVDSAGGSTAGAVDGAVAGSAVSRAAERLPEPARMPVVQLRDVAVRWPGAEVDAVSGVTLTLGPGRRVVVLGPSGSGKSTLLALLLGLLPLSRGSISVDGQEVAGPGDPLPDGLLPAAWLSPQAHLFDSTIERNLLLASSSGGTASKEELEKACRAAGLTNWIKTLPDGLQTAVGPGGLAVSGGERQRIALARALLADRPLLLADEPAAHLDAATADHVTAAVLAPDPVRCTVLVTHRESDADLADEVLRLS
ncbi:amino acid ABC transporter ATP-binding/permease protein [Nakamurella aerolata]|uniref:ATP-binding cassette domain-containing protein n=1 Tax=Nakamurella aerolata TaxID=1656892 RepID=A0A849ACA6_9ACTN|nr:ATP-binding cassette domain-containing protein [Nakamurella aerolata]NNG37226.1 ATP-binding cassette domain-containing protein [Nakamurella aerolata]